MSCPLSTPELKPARVFLFFPRCSHHTVLRRVQACGDCLTYIPCTTSLASPSQPSAPCFPPGVMHGHGFSPHCDLASHWSSLLFNDILIGWGLAVTCTVRCYDVADLEIIDVHLYTSASRRLIVQFAWLVLWGRRKHFGLLYTDSVKRTLHSFLGHCLETHKVSRMLHS